MDIASLCPVCHGTGWVTTSTSEPYDPVQYEDAFRCPACYKGVKEYTGSVVLSDFWELMRKDAEFWKKLGETCGRFVAEAIDEYIKEDAAEKAPAPTERKEGEQLDGGEV